MHRPTPAAPAPPSSAPLALVLLGFGLILPGCLNIVDVEGSDDGVLFTGGRVSYRVRPEAPAAAPTPALEGQVPAAAGDDHRALLIELDGSYGQGEDTLRVAAGDGVTFAGTTFAGPDELALDFDLTRIRANARAIMPLGDGFSLQLLAGAEYSAMAISVDNSPYLPPAAARDTLNAFGPALGLALAWSPAPWLELSGEAAYSFGFSDNADLVELGVCDAGAALWPGGRVSLFLGWRWSRYRAEALDDTLVSDVDLDLAGPVIALRVGF